MKKNKNTKKIKLAFLGLESMEAKKVWDVHFRVILCAGAKAYYLLVTKSMDGVFVPRASP